MANRLKGAWFARATVMAAVFAVPLLGAGAAQAGIAGSPHQVTTNRPDLVSATILTTVPGSVDFCFDKTLASVNTVAKGPFEVAGYRSANSFSSSSYSLETQLPPPSGLPADSCIRANFIGAGDLSQYSVGTLIGPVANIITNGGPPSADNFNKSDSTPLTGSNTHNGTAGFTTGPDLASAIPDSTSNSITYFFDQAITSVPPNVPVAADFWFVDAAGNVCTPTAEIVGGNSVTLTFAGDTCVGGAGPVPSESVSNAVRAGDFAGAVVSANDQATGNDTSLSTNVDNEVAITPSGATSKPDLTDVKLEANQTALDFTFNKTVTPGTAADFFADLSNGTMVSGTNASVIAISTSSTTLRVTFPNFTSYDEYVVGGSVKGTGPVPGVCAVFITAINSDCNGPASQPIDAPFGNIGAFATGFTTAPDAFGAVGNTTTNVVSIAVDQRAFDNTSNAANVHVLDGTGNQIDVSGGTSLTAPSQPAGPQQTVTVQFSSGQIGLASNLWLDNRALGTNLFTNGSAGACTGGKAASDCHDQFNVPQALAIIKTSAILRAEQHLRHANKAAGARLTRARTAAAQRKLARLIKAHH